jgi:hypothetical protein
MTWTLVAVVIGGLATLDPAKVTIVHAGFKDVAECERYAARHGMPVGRITPFQISVTVCFGSTLPPETRNPKPDTGG